MKFRLFLLIVLFPQVGGFSQPQSLAYVLQAEGVGATRQEALNALTECGRDWLIIDPAFESGEAGKWTKQEINKIRLGHSGRKILAYLSIGEAEVYREYWKAEWDADQDGKPDVNAPV